MNVISNPALDLAWLDDQSIWTKWRKEQKDGKWKKPPRDPNGKQCSPNEPHKGWAVRSAFGGAPPDFEEEEQISGLGILLGKLNDLPGSPHLFGIDLDGVLDPSDGGLLPGHEFIGDMLAALPGTYVEISPSRTGLHLLGLVDTPVPDHLFKIELGSEHHNVQFAIRDFFFSFTGNIWNDRPKALGRFKASKLTEAWKIARNGAAVVVQDPGNGDCEPEKTGPIDRTEAMFRISEPFAKKKGKLLLSMLEKTWTGPKQGNDESGSGCFGSWMRALAVCGFDMDRISDSTEEEWLPDEIQGTVKDWGKTETKRQVSRLWRQEHPKLGSIEHAWEQAQEARAKSQAPGRAVRGDEEPWEEELTRNNHGQPLATVSNAMKALNESIEWNGVLRLNEMSWKVELKSPPFQFAQANTASREIRDSDAGHTAVWFEKRGLHYGKEAIYDRLIQTAELNPYHPLRDWLHGLQWDGTPRADRLLLDYFECPDTPLNREAGKRFLMGAMARVMQPGCKNDQVLIIEGAQGIGKSHGFRLLFGDKYFTDSVEDLGGKATMETTQGMWCVELGELNALKGKSLERAKAYITSQIDRFRPSYGRFPTDHPRQFVLVGTHNPDGAEYLGDTSGNRRFLVARAEKVNKARIVQDRDQLWAEAVWLYDQGRGRWWLDQEEDAELVAARDAVNADRQEVDPWAYMLGPWLMEQKDAVSCANVNAQCVRSETVNQEGATSTTFRSPTRMDQTRVGRVMTYLNWEKTTGRIEGEVTKVWVRTPKAEPYRERPY